MAVRAERSPWSPDHGVTGQKTSTNCQRRSEATLQVTRTRMFGSVS